MKKALLVIDMQNVCVGRNHADLFQYDHDELLKAVNQVIEDNSGNTVIYIKNIMKRNLINKLAPFQAYEGTQEVELVSGLKLVSEFVFEKYKGDAFSNPRLNEFLANRQIDTVEVIGVDGGGCVSLTALGAIKKGYKVLVNENAIGTVFEKNRDKYYQKLRRLGADFI